MNRIQDIYRLALIQLIKEKALEHRPFVLPSGKESSYYIDYRKLTLNSEGIRIITNNFINMFDQLKDVDAIGGYSINAYSIVCTILIRYNSRGFHVNIKPKERKLTNLIVEGNLNKGDNVVIIEDITTSGKPAMDAVNIIKEQYGCKVVLITSIVDRLEGARELFGDIPFAPLLTIKDLGL